MRVLGAVLLVLSCSVAGAAERAEDVDKFARWAEPEKDPILCRLKLTERQNDKLLDLHASYAKQKADIIARYKDVKMVMARRGMYRELMQMEAGAEAAFPKVLTAGQRGKMAAGETVLANCRTRVAAINAELEKRSSWAKTNPSAYAEFKKQCDKAIKGWEEHRDRELDRCVGRKPEKGAAGAKTEKIRLDESGTYKSGKWEYTLRVDMKDEKVVARYGSLKRDGKSLHLEKPGAVLETPWGKMKKLPAPTEGKGDGGWMLVKKAP